MKQIPLSRGLFALVDDEDYEFLAQFKWNAFGRQSHVYASGRVGGKTVFMHRLILGITESKVVCDHINGCGTDNRRCNIRPCSHAENMRNQSKIFRETSSIYKGVRFHKRDKKWLARIRCDYKEFHIGTFNDEKSAAIAYNNAAKALHGDFARLNKIE
jgi:hypothetical protein